jgi:hypothetical protein
LVILVNSGLNLPSEDRVRKGAEKLQKYINSKQQGRLDGFFTVQPKTSPRRDKDNADKGKGKTKGKADPKGTKRKVGVSCRYCKRLFALTP